jgi:hypothetical protein
MASRKQAEPSAAGQRSVVLSGLEGRCREGVGDCQIHETLDEFQCVIVIPAGAMILRLAGAP